MSADLPSSNPFRRKAAASTAPSASPSNPSIVNHIAYQQADPLPGSASLEKLDAPKKITKKVRVQSPPPPSPSTPSLPDSSSTIGEEFYSISAKPPTPIPRDDDPFDSIEPDVSEDEEPSILNKAPANPFSKTLETMEHTGRDGPVIVPPNVSSPGRASMDVEAFKRLLMTGSAGLGASTSSSAAQAHVAHHALGDGGSSTDTSSLSRQSIFEAIQEPHPESPRTSHEISEPEDDRSAVTAEFLSSTAGRKKPPPPSSRHGKLIKVELKDDSIQKPLQSPPTPGSFTSQQYFSSGHRSQTDLNKPLPPAPRASHEVDRESIFDKEAAGKTPEPPSPSSSIRRKTPPPRPLTRRHSQLVSESKLTRSNTTGRLSPKAEEDNISIRRKENNRPRSDSVKVPPPPPSRRPTSINRGSSHNSSLTSPSTVSLPPPPPARGSSRSISGRPPSVHSMDISSNNNNKRASMFPPPPPPHRHGRTSMEAQSADASRRPSGEQSRRSIESARRGSAASSMLEAERIGGISGGHDILADLSALQREIDALRTQSEKQRVT
jgi:hypothetical protein